MIYIDTKNTLSLKRGVMDFLNITEEELEQIFETMDCVNNVSQITFSAR